MILGVDYIPDFYICYNWFDVSYDLDYSISERMEHVRLCGRVGSSLLLKAVIF